MTHASKMRRMTAFSVGALVLSTLSASPALAAQEALDPTKPLYVNPVSTTAQAAVGLSGQQRADAQLLASFPSASWFTQGTPAEVNVAVDALVDGSSAAGAVPVLVAYNLPYRDCSQYSAGGAADTAAYNAWIDAFAAGIGSRDAVVILEPDGLGIIPWYTTVNGDSEWCKPVEADPATAAADRFAQLNHAVDVIGALSNTTLYLDGTHSGWLGVGDITDRLIKAGVERADGFFLNASNYVLNERLQKYAKWVSDCIALSVGSWWEPQWCASQYYPANPADFSTWGLSDAAYDQAFADTGLVRNPATQKHAVIDTSRNGQGPWTPPEGVYSDPEVWCNPPDRGLGVVPTTTTGDPYVDAFLWIKVPGESDGRCFRGTGGPEDPERNMVDPEAGRWFPQQAAELIRLANPAIAKQTCDVDYTVHGTWPDGANVQVWIKNTGTTPINGWALRWTFAGPQSIKQIWSASASTSGGVVTAQNLSWNRVIKPGERLTFGFITKTVKGAAAEPLLFTLNNLPCTSR